MPVTPASARTTWSRLVSAGRRGAGVAAVALVVPGWACTEHTPPEETDLATVSAEVEAAVWAFHAADTAMDAEAVLSLLWPEYEMIVDGSRTNYEEVVEGSKAFMGSLDFFHTTWSDVRIVPLSRDIAISTFFFRDSIGTREGELTRSEGPNTFVWERREGEWRVRFGNADHRPISP